MHIHTYIDIYTYIYVYIYLKITRRQVISSEAPSSSIHRWWAFCTRASQAPAGSPLRTKGLMILRASSLLRNSQTPSVASSKQRSRGDREKPETSGSLVTPARAARVSPKERDMASPGRSSLASHTLTRSAAQQTVIWGVVVGTRQGGDRGGDREAGHDRQRRDGQRDIAAQRGRCRETDTEAGTQRQTHRRTADADSQRLRGGRASLFAR